jgi:hypothetical protein
MKEIKPRPGKKVLVIRSGKRINGFWLSGKVGKGSFYNSSSILTPLGRKAANRYAVYNNKRYYAFDFKSSKNDPRYWNL